MIKWSQKAATETWLPHVYIMSSNIFVEKMEIWGQHCDWVKNDWCSQIHYNILWFKNKNKRNHYFHRKYKLGALWQGH